MKLPKKEQCEENSHSFWKFETPDGKPLGHCQRCGVQRVLKDKNAPRAEVRSNRTVLEIINDIQTQSP